MLSILVQNFVMWEWVNLYPICQAKCLSIFVFAGVLDIFVAFVEDNATMSSIRYFENHVSYFVQNQRK